MVLFTGNIKKNERLLNQFSESKNVYIHCQESKLYFYDDKYIGRLHIDLEQNLAIEGFYVDLKLLLSLCQRYEDLEITEDLKFSSGKEKFNIPVTKEDFDLAELVQNNNQIELSKTTVENITSAMAFVDYSSAEYCGVDYYGNVVASGNRTFFFEVHNDVSFDNKVTFNDIALKVFKGLGANDVVSLSTNEKAINLSINEKDIEIQIAKYVETSLPTINEGFKSKYAHETNITFEKQTILNALKFLQPFTANVLNERIVLQMKEGELSLIVEDDICAEQHIEIDSISESLIGHDFPTFREHLYRSINEIKDDFVSIKINCEKNDEGKYIKPVFAITGKTNQSKNIISIRQK